MERSEACNLLTKIASSELIDMLVSKELIKARDIVVCEPNKILDVLATDEQRGVYARQTKEYLKRLLGTEVLDIDIARTIRNLIVNLDNGFNGKCKTAHSKIRCSNCPNYGSDNLE